MLLEPTMSASCRRALLTASLVSLAVTLSASNSLADGGVGGAFGGAGGLDNVTGAGGAGGPSSSVGGGGGGGGAGATGGNGGDGGPGGSAGGLGGTSAGASGENGTDGIGAGGGGGGAHGFVGAGLPIVALPGGNGGNGGIGIGGGQSGGGGAGGYGAVVTGTGNFGPLNVAVTGGNGGSGGPDTGTGGGSGGIGLIFTNAAAINVTLAAPVTGGDGGLGGSSVGTGGPGGGGGVGAQFDGNGSNVVNSNAVTGGRGGGGGSGGGIGFGGNGGNGGAGVVFTTGGATFTNSGTVSGGAGGAGGSGGFLNGNAGAGGVGVTGSSLTVINSGTIAGAGTANAITFTGGTNTLELQAGSTITGNVVAFSTADTFRLGGTTDGSFDVTNIGVAAQFSGFGIFQKNGTSTWTLTGSTAATTGWSINAGTLAVTDDANLGNAAGGLAFNGGTLRVSSGGGPTVALARAITLQAGGGTIETIIDTILTGNISGAGGLTKTGNHTLSLAGTNNYVGATNVMSGQLQSDSAGAFSAASAFTVAAGAAIELRGSQQSIGSLAGAGAVTNNNVAAAVLTTGLDNTSTTFSGIISDAGVGLLSLIKAGSGTQTLSGVNTYGGTTTVNGGTLAVDGSIATSSLTTVNAGGTLGGTGTVGNTIINGGTLSPGNSIGTFTVAGNLVFTAAASYMVEVSPASSDRTNVTGSALLGGATVNVSFAAGTYVAKQYTILNATSGLANSTFGSVVNTNLPGGFNSSLSYDNNNAYLNLALAFVPPAGTGLSVNQQNVGNAIVNFFNTTGGIPMVFGGLTPAGLTQISGETATGSQQTTFNAMNQFMGVMTDPFIAGRGDPISGGGNPNAYAGQESLAYAASGKSRSKSERDAYAAIYTKAPPIVQSFEQRWSVWAAGFGGSQTTDGNTIVGSNNTRSSLAAGAVGADYRISPNTLAGFALAGGGTNFSVNGFGSGRSDLFQAGAFIRHNVGAAYLSGALAYGWQDITTDRTVAVAGIDRLRAQFNAIAWSGRVEGGYRFVSQGFGWTPYAAGQFTTFELPNYAEQAIVGANTFALAYNAKSVTDTRSELGLRTDKSFAMPDGIFTLRGRAAWAHDFNPDRAIGATFQTLPGASFVVNGAAQATDAALVTASAELKWINGWSTAATFEGEFSNVTSSYAGKGVVRYAW
jgi:uncharacterized protein with beta-barrel porin domain